MAQPSAQLTDVELVHQHQAIFNQHQALIAQHARSYRNGDGINRYEEFYLVMWRAGDDIRNRIEDPRVQDLVLCRIAGLLLVQIDPDQLEAAPVAAGPQAARVNRFVQELAGRHQFWNIAGKYLNILYYGYAPGNGASRKHVDYNNGILAVNALIEPWMAYFAQVQNVRTPYDRFYGGILRIYHDLYEPSGDQADPLYKDAAFLTVLGGMIEGYKLDAQGVVNSLYNRPEFAKIKPWLDKYYKYHPQRWAYHQAISEKFGRPLPRPLYPGDVPHPGPRRALQQMYQDAKAPPPSADDMLSKVKKILPIVGIILLCLVLGAGVIWTLVSNDNTKLTNLKF